MIGMVLVSHGQLATEFRLAMEHVVGRQPQVATVCIGPEDDMDARRGEIVAAIKAVDAGDGVVVLTDMFGGTPSNLAISAMNGANVEVIAGINLPMLVKLAKVRETTPLAEAVTQAQDAGKKYINVASHILAGR
ncbi:MAG TPA: PTS sugar transporter subunit IIA [Rhabdaerophilum sp.]|nr:PTS sugar transporter subunit IIA [Rhabdaerophilum sp.]